jgi:hypothetical protein
MVQGRRVMSEVTLVTGFAGYGGRGRNPSAETAKALDGKTVGGLKVVGRILPVSHAKLQPLLQDLFEELRPGSPFRSGCGPVSRRFVSSASASMSRISRSLTTKARCSATRR